MQKEHPETPKRRIKRVRNAATPELPKKNNVNNITISRAGSSRHRATMAPSDFSQSLAPKDIFPRRRVGKDRMSVLPSQLPSEGLKTVEPDNTHSQLELLYDEYLQGIMTGIILKKKTEEAENKILAELATIAKERDHDEEKLFKLKAREMDIVKLSAAQNEVDCQILDADKCIKDEKIKGVGDVLSQLLTCLQPLDILQCHNITLPKTTEEWNKTEEILKKCVITLQSITEMIGSKGEAYRVVYNGIKDFIKTHSEIETDQKRLQKALSDLQILVLKTASLSLKEDNDITDL